MEPELREVPKVDRMWSIEAEAAVLGSMLIEPKCIGDVIPILPEVDMFFSIPNRIIYNALLFMFIEKKAIDGIMLRTELSERGDLLRLGSDLNPGCQSDSERDLAAVRYIGRLIEAFADTANVVYYAGVVKARADYRALMEMVDKLSAVLAEYAPVGEQWAKMQHIMLAQAERQSAAKAVIQDPPTTVAADELVNPDKSGAIATGYPDLDDMVRFAPGDLAIIAARPSVGKTALALNIAENMALAGHGVLFVSAEMTATALTKRLICHNARIGRHAAAYNADSIKKAADAVNKLPFKIVDSVSSLAAVVAFVRRAKQQYGIDVVVVDYIQQLSADDAAAKQNRNQEISLISRSLKHLALSDEVLVLCLSQLNRGVEARQDKRPRMSDLRDSGSLEQDADQILMLYREDYYGAEKKAEPSNEDKGEIIVAKQRDGATGVVYMVWVARYASWETAARVPDVPI